MFANKLIKVVREKWHNDLIGDSKNSNSLNTILSYIYNERMMQMGEKNYRNSEKYIFFEKIHKILKLLSFADKTIEFNRVGNTNDGGYTMFLPLSENKIAYSIGISNDTSWDSDMASRGYEVYMYDHTIKNLPNKNRAFHWEKLGIIGGRETKDLIELSTMIHRNGHDNETGMVLKMDVEGAEWDVLRYISSDVLCRFDQIVMELHDLLNPFNREIYLEALDKITSTHSLVHIHANNCSNVDFCGELMLPNVLEVTFVLTSRFDLKESDVFLPRKEDAPCNKEYADIILGRWNIE